MTEFKKAIYDQIFSGKKAGKGREREEGGRKEGPDRRVHFGITGVSGTLSYKQ